MISYLILLLFLLGGCVPIPEEHHPCSLSDSPSLEKTIEKGFAEDVLILTTAPIPSAWWEIFENPQLSYLIDKALQHNPSLQEAMARVEIARNEAKIQRSALFPTIWLNGKETWEHLPKVGFFRAYAPTIPPKVTIYSLDLDFTYEFDFWGKRGNLYEAALGRTQAQEAEKSQADLLISTALAATYFKLQSNFQELHLLMKQQDMLASLVEIRKRREKHALDSKSQVLDAENALSIIQQQVLLSKQNIELTKHQLLNLMGVGPDDEEEICQISLDAAIQVPIPECLPCDLLAYRPDLIAQIWRVEAVAHEVGAAKADFYPNIDLTALVGLESVFIDKLFSKDALSSSVSEAFHLPIFTAGRIKANLESKRALLEEEIKIYNRLLLDAAKDVADRMVTLRTAKQNLSLQSSIIQNRAQSKGLVNLRFKNALDNSINTLEANLEILRQKFLEADIQYQYYLAIIELMRALGGGYQAPCRPV